MQGNADAADNENFESKNIKGRQAKAPTAIPMGGWKDVAWRVYGALSRNRLMLVAAGLTYYTLLTMVPALSFLVSIYGLFASPKTVLDQLQLMQGFVPPGGLDLIRTELTRLVAQSRQTLSITLLISLAGTFWGAGLAIRGMIDSMNIVYGEEEKRNFVHVILLSFAFTLGATLAAIIVLSAVLVIPVVLSFLPFGGALEWLVRLAAYVLMALVLLMALAALYRWGPSRTDARWRWVTPGSIFATLGFILVSAIFSWYAANFGNYDATYGSLGALIGMLTWIWLSITVVILGGAINAETEHQTMRDSTVGPEKPIGERGAFVADDVGPGWGE